MKNHCIKIKWVAGQARPFFLPLFLSVLLGGMCSLSGVFLALLSKQLIDCATAVQVHRMFRYVFIICALLLADVCTRAFASAISAQNHVRITNNMRQKLYARFTRINWLELSRYHSGDVLTRMTSDVDTVANLLSATLPNIIALVVALTGSLASILIFEPVLAVLLLMLGPVLIIISRFYSRKLKKLYTNTQETESVCRSFIHESIQNMPIIKTFCLEQRNTEHLGRLQKDKLSLVSRRSRVSAVSNSILILSSWLGYFLVFIWGALNLSNGIASFGTFTALLQLVGHIQGPFSGLAQTLPQIISAFASVERLMELEALQLDTGETPTSGKYPAGIQFEEVSFGYEKGIRVLENISAIIYPGEITALIGPSGEGKTTFIRLLLSLILPEAGHVYIISDGRKYDTGISSRKLIAYVPQENSLFSGTIADNLRYGCPDADDSELEAAARAACAWEFIEKLPSGLQTVVGERGIGLSQGQAQRIAIARALLRKSPILVLDEATSALDSNTEQRVLQTIHSLSPTCTCLVITHRLTALKICHRVLKLEDGRLTELHNKVTEVPTIEAV